MANKAEPLEKLTKVTYKVIDFTQAICQAIFKVSSTAFTILASRLKEASELLEVVQIGGRYHELFCPDEKGHYFVHTNTWQRIADRVFLTAHVTFKTIGFIATMSLITLGRIGAYLIGRLTTFKLVTEALVCISASFGLWDTKNKLTTSYKDLKLANSKLEKWRHRPEFLERIRQGDAAVSAKLEQSYEEKSLNVLQRMRQLEEKSDHIKSYMALLEKSEEAQSLPEKLVKKLEKVTADELAAKYAEKIHAIADRIAALQLKQKKYDERLVNISSKEYKALAEKLSNKDIDYQVLKWETTKDNVDLSITKSWLAVAKSVFKLAVVTLAVSMLAANIFTLSSTLAILALGIFHDGIGLAKIFHDEYVHTKPMPPLAAPVPAA
jgi:hypothetical protein